MAVRMLVARPGRPAAIGIVRVIHTGAEIRIAEVFILLIESEIVADLLAARQPTEVIAIFIVSAPLRAGSRQRTPNLYAGVLGRPVGDSRG
jgi:hypothetical protein